MKLEDFLPAIQKLPYNHFLEKTDLLIGDFLMETGVIFLCIMRLIMNITIQMQKLLLLELHQAGHKCDTPLKVYY
ncbi:hypothetical protein [Bacillus sp. B1-b2]|uniref:hypothetical protein n=1 Tax=Bacillus sp. B1-b2 TaxID=2653201 RepID=UPI001D0157EB|nr:hypothetical protein [Bacillus sp. B1-b2]